MLVRTLFQCGGITVSDYRCTAGPNDQAFAEHHTSHSISYVRSGSFGCRSRGRSHELVAGALLIGHPGDEYTCHHEHHGCGDECLSFAFAPELVDAIGDDRTIWQQISIAPLAELMVFGELAQAAANARNDLGLDEIGHAFAHASSMSSRVSGASISPTAPGIAGAPSKRHCGSMPMRARPSISMTPPGKPG
jgi:hypothetical protein